MIEKLYNLWHWWKFRRLYRTVHKDSKFWEEGN